jgi:hypothetical protein
MSRKYTCIRVLFASSFVRAEAASELTRSVAMHGVHAASEVRSRATEPRVAYQGPEMPNLTVIEGTQKERDAFAATARQNFTALIIEILRAVERGDDRDCRVHEKLVYFCLEVSKCSTPHSTIIREAVQSAHRSAIDPYFEKMSDHEMEMRFIIGSALQVAAETMCSDPFARARASRRQRELRASIDDHLSERQRRSRKRAGTEPYNPWYDI